MSNRYVLTLNRHAFIFEKQNSMTRIETYSLKLGKYAKLFFSNTQGSFQGGYTYAVFGFGKDQKLYRFALLFTK